MDRGMLNFSVKLSAVAGKPNEMAKPRIVVKNAITEEEILQDPWEFLKRFSIVQDEYQKLKHALGFGIEYTVPDTHDPLTLLFDTSFHVGSAKYFLMEYSMLMETEQPESDLVNAVPPYDVIGKFKMTMTPIKSPDDHTPLSEEDLEDLVDPEDLKGKPWTYLLQVHSVNGLRLNSQETFCQIQFNDETFFTEVSLSKGKDIAFEYKQVLHVPCVDQAFVSYLDDGVLSFDVFVNAITQRPDGEDHIVSTNNPTIRKLMATHPVVPKDLPAGRLHRATFDAIEKEIKQVASKHTKLLLKAQEIKSLSGISRKEDELSTLSALAKAMTEPQVPLSGRSITASEYAIYVDDFQSIDSDGSGYIEISELPLLFKKQTGRDAQDAEITALLKEFDTNMDGRIEFSEYLNVLMGPNWRITGGMVFKQLSKSMDEVQARIGPRVDWDIPKSAAQITPEFLSKVFHKAGVMLESESVVQISKPTFWGQGVLFEVASFDITYNNPAAITMAPTRIFTKMPKVPIGEMSGMNFARAAFIAEKAGYRDIKLNLHRVPCYFAQGSCIILKAAENHVKVDSLTSVHVEIALTSLANVNAEYWNFSPTFNPKFMYDDPIKRVPFFRHIVAPGLKAAAVLFPSWKAELEALATVYATKMEAINEKFFGGHSGIISLGCADFKLADISFVHKGETLTGINNVLDFQPMFQHPMAMVSQFIVRSLSPPERKDAEKKLVETYHNNLMAFGMDGMEFTFETCWEDYVNRVAYVLAVNVALNAVKEVKAKNANSQSFKDLSQLTERVCSAVKDHGIVAKFVALSDDS